MRPAARRAADFPSIVGTTAVGSIPDETFVDEAGQFHWHMSIPVPPGRAGMEPHLGIDYQSGGPETALGVGFALSGLSAISRCAHTLAQDGDVRRVMLDANDAFCMGGERLRPQRDGTFRTEHESWQQIQIRESDAKGPLSFVVTQPNGHQRIYGSNEASRMLARRPPRLAQEQGTDVVQSWLLSEEVDPSGNLVEYRYEHIHTSVSDVTWAPLIQTRDLVRIASIVYTGFVDQTGTTSGTRAVTFEYGPPRGARHAAALADVVIANDTAPEGGFFDGSFGWAPASTPLLRIRTFVAGQLVHLLRLRGGDGSQTDTAPGVAPIASHQYRLFEIQLCANAPPAEEADRDPEGDPANNNITLVCLPSTRFDWLTRTSSQPSLEPGYGLETFEEFDRGSGRLVTPLRPTCTTYPDGVTYCNEPISNPVITLDVNGDGADDLVYPNSDPDQQSGRLIVRLGVPSPDRSSASLDHERIPYTDGYAPTGLPAGLNFSHAAALDWNLDGRDDLLLGVGNANTGTESLTVFLSDGRDFHAQPTGLTLPIWSATSRRGYYPNSHLELADLDGDGRQDVLACQWEWAGPGQIFAYEPADPPLVSPRGRWAFSLRTNSGYGPLVASGISTECDFEYGVGHDATFDYMRDDYPVFDFHPAVGDFDGDGRQELVVAPRFDARNQFFSTRILGLHNGVLTESLVSAADDLARGGTPTVADFNGDGLSDILINHLGSFWGNPSDAHRDPFDPFFGIDEVRTVLRFSTGRFIDGIGRSPSRYEFTPYVRVNVPNATAFRDDPRTRAGHHMPNNRGIERVPLDALAFEMNGDGRADLLFGTLSASRTTPSCTDDFPSFCEWPQQQLWVGEVLGDFEAAIDAYPTTGVFEGARLPNGPNPRDDLFRIEEHYRVDADGDGALDVVALRHQSPRDPADSIEQIRLLHNLRSLPALVASVHDGHGAFVNVHYTTLADSTVYRSAAAVGATCGYPQRCVTSSQWVVQRMETDAGLDVPAVNVETHTYEDARVDLRGRGSLGFARHVVRREPSGEVTDTRYDLRFDATVQDYPFAGRPQQRWTYRVATPSLDLLGEPASTSFVGHHELHTSTGRRGTMPYDVVVHGNTYSVLGGQTLVREFESAGVPANPALAFETMTPVHAARSTFSYDSHDNVTHVHSEDVLGTATQDVRACM